MRVASVAVRAERNENAPEGAQQVVGIDGRRMQREASDHDERAQREHAAVRGRLGRDVDDAQHRNAAQPRDHGQPVADDERVDQRDHERERRREGQRPQHGAGDARARRGAQQREQQDGEDERVLEGQRDARQHHAPRRRDRRAGGVQRARAAAVGHGASGSGTSGNGTARPSSTAIAKWLRSASGSSCAAAAASPTASVPVMIQVGASSRSAVAATSPPPAPIRRSTRPRGSSRAIESPAADGRA